MDEKDQERFLFSSGVEEAEGKGGVGQKRTSASECQTCGPPGETFCREAAGGGDQGGEPGWGICAQL